MGKKVTITLDLENGQFVTKLKKADAQLDQFTKTAKAVRTALTGAFSMVAGRQILSWTKELVGSFMEYSEKQAKATGQMNATAAQIIGMTKEWDRMKVAVGEGLANAFVKVAAAAVGGAAGLKQFNDEASKTISSGLEASLLKISSVMTRIYQATEAISGVFRPFTALFTAPIKTIAEQDKWYRIDQMAGNWFKNLANEANPMKDWANIFPAGQTASDLWGQAERTPSERMHQESLRIANETIQRMRNQAATQPK